MGSGGAGKQSWAGVEAYARAQRDAIARLGAAVAEDAPESVHKLRVACRRLRSTLRTFAPYFDGNDAKAVRDELRWLAGELSAARDLEVTAEELRTALADEPPDRITEPIGQRIDDYLATHGGTARQRALAAVGDPRYSRLVERIDGVLADAPIAHVRKRELKSLTYKALRRVDKRLDAVSEGDTEALHDARKTAKRARYAMEALRDLAPTDARHSIRRLKRLQDVLGDHRDALNTQQLVWDLGRDAYADREDAFAYGVLYARQEARATQALTKLPAAEKALRERSVRAWLR